MDNALLGFLGILRRAGKVSYGYDAVAREILKHNAQAVLLASDASERTKRAVENICSVNDLKPVETKFTAETLGACLGRDRVAVVSVAGRKAADKAGKLCRGE